MEGQNVIENITQVCKHNQRGYCRNGNSCELKHNDNICKNKVCRSRSCTERHPKSCIYFEKNSFCRYKEKCAYAHHPVKDKDKIDVLVKEVGILRDMIEKLSKTNEDMYEKLNEIEVSNISNNEKQIDIIKAVNQIKEKDQAKGTNNDVAQIKTNANKPKNRKLKVTMKSKAKEAGKAKIYKCKKCDYNCAKEITLKKHTNTKHKQKEINCDKCPDVFFSKNMLDLHIEEEHRYKSDMQKQLEQKECSLCEDKFLSSDDYDNHVKEHLEEIKDIDFEYLKNGHEIFDCSKCDFQSNSGEDVKNHLVGHVIVQTQPLENKQKTKKEMKELILKTGDWRDLYDHEGNPMYDTTESEFSSDDDQEYEQDNDQEDEQEDE